MRVVMINTTAYEEENFYLLTTLSDDQIAEVIQPIVNAERDGYEEYDNEMLTDALKQRFPLDHIEMFYEFEQLNF
jgi:hypothetical protein